MAAEPLTPGNVNDAYEKVTTMEPKKRGCCSPRALGTTCIVIGAIILVLGIVFSTAMPSVITKKINSGVAICKNEDVNKVAYTDSYGDCEDCTPYYYRLSMFNVTNAEDYLNKGAKLKVQEVGPYTYRRRQIKVDVKVENGGETVSYKMYNYHTFDRKLSCPTCSDQDQVLSWDVGYLNIMSQSGGEKGFLRKLIAGTIWGGSLTATEIDAVIAKDGVKIMRWANGLNSNEPKAMNAVGQSVMLFLAGGVSALDAIDVSGFEFNGLFVRRTISEWALGYPSLLAGLGLGTNYNKVCSPTGKNLMAQCASCTGQACFDLYSECKRCDMGKKVTEINSVTCPLLGKKVADVFGKEAGDKFMENTCGTYCAQIGICVAPLPGVVESSGLDFSKNPPPSSSLQTYIQKTGCKDKNVIGEYIQYNGYKTSPYWVKLDKRRNPTLAEMNAFAIYGNCANPTANMTCSDVIGNDATSVKPAGASIRGFPDKIDIQANVMYLSQSKQNVTLLNTGKVYTDIDGIKLTRFVPPTDLLTWKPETDNKGVGYPVDGVQPLAFNVGLLAYLSFPMFMHGDKSLTEGVDITMLDGVKATPENMFVNGELKKEYYDRYQTYIDMEPGTGKAMRARKRLMASYALAQSQFTPSKSISDLVYPNLKYEVISPAYIGEEMATIGQTKIVTYKGVKGLLASLIPILIVSIVLGLALLGGGFIYRKRAAKAANMA